MCPRGTVTSGPRPPLGPIVVYSPERGAVVPGGKLLTLAKLNLLILVLPVCASLVLNQEAVVLPPDCWGKCLRHFQCLPLRALSDRPRFVAVVMSVVYNPGPVMLKIPTEPYCFHIFHVVGHLSSRRGKDGFLPLFVTLTGVTNFRSPRQPWNR